MKISRALALFLVSTSLHAAPQEAPQAPGAESASAVTRNAVVPAAAVAPPAGYVIGPDDHLKISFWRNTELSAEVVVRPDGRISLPLLNDVEAAGLTPEQLRDRLIERARSFVEDANATVVVAEIRSRRVFIAGNVDKPGAYPLNSPTTVLQLIATAGGLREFVKGKDIVIVRGAGEKQSRFKFNYQDVVRGKRLAQNIALQPGDTVIVP
jgi:polysaccharide export outer membrane protein